MYKRQGVQGVGITLSAEQQKKFSERIMAEGLEDRLRVELMDYRDLAPVSYTHLISIWTISNKSTTPTVTIWAIRLCK